jgi:hypothetical protein
MASSGIFGSGVNGLTGTIGKAGWFIGIVGVAEIIVDHLGPAAAHLGVQNIPGFGPWLKGIWPGLAAATAGINETLGKGATGEAQTMEVSKLREAVTAGAKGSGALNGRGVPDADGITSRFTGGTAAQQTQAYALEKASADIVDTQARIKNTRVQTEVNEQELYGKKVINRARQRFFPDLAPDPIPGDTGNGGNGGQGGSSLPTNARELTQSFSQFGLSIGSG